LEKGALVHLFDALRFLYKGKDEQVIASLKLCKAELDSFASEIIPNEYYRMAANGETP
jgi:hypothetical protein